VQAGKPALVWEAPPDVTPAAGQAAAQPPGALQPSFWQGDDFTAPGDVTPFRIQLEPPGLERLAQSVQSDEALRERIRQESRERHPIQRDVFPPEPVLSTVPISSNPSRDRRWQPSTLQVAPYFVAYRRLLFEEKNSERYGWDFGVVQPVVSCAYFLWDYVMLPYHLATAPTRCYEFNSGYCLPGDPVPYYIYPVELSVTGAVAEVGTILALVAIFP
jgi:hypothetical protein